MMIRNNGLLFWATLYIMSLVLLEMCLPIYTVIYLLFFSRVTHR